jgi:hypothetical protein
LLTCNKVPDPTWPNTPNGCGPGGNDDISDNPAGWACWASSGDDSDFVGACDNHDICYGTCGGNSWTECNSNFGADMNAVCNSPNNSPQCKVACQAARVSYWGAVEIVGWYYYEIAQVQACACCDCN